MEIETPEDRMPENLEGMVANMTENQRLYCEYRSKGLSLKESARKAGSNASEERLKNVGYQTEQAVGVKEYIEWLRLQYSKAAILDATEILEKLRRIHNKAFQIDKLKEATDAVKLMGQMIGFFGYGKIEKEEKASNGRNNTASFKEESGMEENETSDRIQKLQSMLKDLNKDIK